MADRAAARGCRPTVVDLRTLEPTAQGLTAAIREATSDVAEPRHLVVIDTFEKVAGLQEWARTNLLDLLPASTIVVIAGRDGPPPSWRFDPLWGSLLEVLPLRALPLPESAELLGRIGVGDVWCDRAAELAHGHPLALVLLGDVLATSGTLPSSITDRADLISALLGCIADDSPSTEHRRALDVAAMTRVTTRGLLRHVFGTDRGEGLFDWLSMRPFVESLDDGLRPHELARQVLEADLRRNDPDGYADLHHRIRRYMLSQRDRPGSATTMVQDIIYLHRFSSMMSAHWDWASFGAVETTGLRRDDEATLVELVTRHDGEAEAEILRYWIGRQPDAFTIVRTPSGQILGFLAILVLEEPTDEDLATDPAIAAIWQHASRNDPPRSGQVVGIHRYYEDRCAGQNLPSVTFNVVSSATTAAWLTTPGLSWFYIAPIRDAGLWAPMMGYLDFHPVRTADHVIGDTIHYVYCHDWRRLGPPPGSTSWNHVSSAPGSTRRSTPPPSSSPSPRRRSGTPFVPRSATLPAPTGRATTCSPCHEWCGTPGLRRRSATCSATQRLPSKSTHALTRPAERSTAPTSTAPPPRRPPPRSSTWPSRPTADT